MFEENMISTIFDGIFPEIKKGFVIDEEIEAAKQQLLNYLHKKYLKVIKSWTQDDYTNEDIERKKHSIIQMELRCWKDKPKEDRMKLLKKYS